MEKEIINLSKHTMIYGAGMMISKAVSFVMLPIYTRYLTPGDYGTVELLTTTLDIVVIIAGVGITATIFKYYNEYESQSDKNEVISTAIIMVLWISALTGILGILLSPQISNLIFHQTDNQNYFRILFIIYFLNQGIIVIPLLFIRAMHNSKVFIFISLVKLSIQVSLNIYFLIFLKMGIMGVLSSTLIADFVIGIYLSIYTFKRVGFRFSISKAKQIIHFGYPFIFVALSGFVLAFSDRYFLNHFSDLNTVGIYALAYKFGFLMGYLAVAPFMLIWEPQRLEIAKQSNALSFFKRVFLKFNIVIISLSLLICLFVKDALTVMADPAYLDAYKLVPLIVLAYIFQAWTSYCNIGIYLKTRSQYLAFATGTAALTVILLNFLLIPQYGAYGAIWATFGAFILRFTMVYMLSQKLYPIDYGWSKQLQLLMFGVFVYLISRAFEIEQLVLSLTVNTGLMLLFGITIYILFLDHTEKLAVKKIMQNPFSIIRLENKLKP